LTLLSSSEFARGFLKTWSPGQAVRTKQQHAQCEGLIAPTEIICYGCEWNTHFQLGSLLEKAFLAISGAKCSNFLFQYQYPV